MKGKMAVVLISLMTVVGIGCGGEDRESPDNPWVTRDEPVEQEEEMVSNEGEETTNAVAEDEEMVEEESASLIPANCTLDEVATTVEIRRSIIAGNILLATVTYEIDAESGGFVSINGGNCSYDYAYFTETDTTLCHTVVPCDDWQFEYYVDFTNRSHPVWVLLEENTRWVLGDFTGTLPPVSASSGAGYTSGSYTGTSTSTPTTWGYEPSGGSGDTDDGTGWYGDVQDAYRGQGEAMPYYPVASW